MGGNLRNCPYHLICEIFGDYAECNEDKKVNCCIYLLNELDQTNYEDCNKCINISTCKELRNNDPTPFLEVFEEFNKILGSEKAYPDFNIRPLEIKTPFIPIIEYGRNPVYMKKQLEIINKVDNIDWIVVSLKRMVSYSSKDKLSLINSCRTPLHDKLGPHTKIILYTAIKDQDCKKIIDYPSNFIDVIEQDLKPDAITSVDGNFRVYLPIAVLFYHLWQVIKADIIILSKTDIPCIGILPPELEISELCVRLLGRLGFKHIGIPMMEINSEKKAKKEMYQYISKFSSNLTRNSASKTLEYIAFSCSPNRHNLLCDRYSCQLPWYHPIDSVQTMLKEYLDKTIKKRKKFSAKINEKTLWSFIR